MKPSKAFTIIIVVGLCCFAAYWIWHLQQRDAIPGGSVQTVSSKCDQTLWTYVYNPNRLRVLSACTSARGSVDYVRREADGDFHIGFRLDAEFASMLNDKNLSEQHGDLVLEMVCQGKVRQADAVDACSRYDGPNFKPQVGKRYLVWGAYVYDAEHGWNELHPVTSMEEIE